MDYFPVFLDLRGRTVLVLGGGMVATRKINLLLRAKAKILVVAKNLNSELSEMVKKNEVEWFAKEFDSSHLNSVFLVVCATGDSSMSNKVFDIVEREKKWVNAVDDQNNCNFIFPSIVDRNPIQIAISSGGTAPVLVRLLREMLEALVPHYFGVMASIAGKWRDKVKERFLGLARRRFWENAFTGRFSTLVMNNRIEEAESELEISLSEDHSAGFISLVGAGPGDPGLLTLAALREMQKADVVLYDSLVSKEILDLVRRDADLIFVGKSAGESVNDQSRINSLILDLVSEGKYVVRLKGGDPFIFGRGAEELELLVDNGILFSVVPGVTAALGVSAYAGIPLTHRDHSQRVIFLTGHTAFKDLEWSVIARDGQTLVIYMGKMKAREISENLISSGLSAETPTAVISRGTRFDQSILVGDVKDLGDLADQVPGPVLIIVGEVVRLRNSFSWFGEDCFTVNNLLFRGNS